MSRIINQPISSPRGKTGWTDEERRFLWEEVERAGETSAALRGVFESVASLTGRKPNSIRNYYYLSIKEGAAPKGINCQRAMPFVPFTQEELHWLVREVLYARSCGESVRACVARLGEGDRARTLRYQNKYRSVLKTRPDYIKEVMQELESEGVYFDEMFTPVRKKRPQASFWGTGDDLSGKIMSFGKPGEAFLQALHSFLDEISDEMSIDGNQSDF